MKRYTALLVLTGVACAKYWMEDIGHHGISPYNTDPVYQVFRNVREFGAVGDGVTDDTSAINAAISTGNRCGPGICKGSVSSPATVYFPGGTYLITNSIIDFYHTQLIGDPTDRPVIKASSEFNEFAFGLIDANPYQPGGSLAWNSTNTFFRQIRNLVLDTTAIPASNRAVGIHWPSSQATSITNCMFRLSIVPGNRHIGLFIEEGSGGLLNDLYFYGGGPAAIFGNQQYTARNLWFFNADIAINVPWNWGWTLKSVHFKDCRVGIQMDQDQKSTGSLTLLDSWFQDVGIALITTRRPDDNLSANGTLAMENVVFDRVDRVLEGPTGTILTESNLVKGPDALFIMGHVVDNLGLFAQSGYYNTTDPIRNPSLLTEGKYYERSKPQYEGFPMEYIFSARVYGAKGDGVTDDTQALNALFDYTARSGFIAHLDAGTYLVSDTVFIPPGARIVGEALGSIIMAAGSKFWDMTNPYPVIKVGNPGQVGRVEWSDTFVSTRGPCAGAILIQYNLFSPYEPSGMWDVHTRIGGFPGTDLQLAQCPALDQAGSIDPKCIAAFMSMHITASAGGLLTENCWFWVADHDLEDQLYRRVTIFAGRGLLIESQRGRIWLSATGSEHHVLYQYQLANTRDIYMGHLQTESPYFQPIPLARYPFPAIPAIYDPDFAVDCQGVNAVASCESSWAMRILGSTGIVVYGAGLYSFFSSYDFTCSRPNSTTNCQDRLLSVQNSAGGIKFLGLSTVATRIMVQQNGIDLVPSNYNVGTFADTLALYRH